MIRNLIRTSRNQTGISHRRDAEKPETSDKAEGLKMWTAQGGRRFALSLQVQTALGRPGSAIPGHTISIFFASLIRAAAGRRPARPLRQETVRTGNTEEKVLLERSNYMSHPAKPGVHVRAIIGHGFKPIHRVRRPIDVDPWKSVSTYSSALSARRR